MATTHTAGNHPSRFAYRCPRNPQGRVTETSRCAFGPAVTFARRHGLLTGSGNAYCRSHLSK